MPTAPAIRMPLSATVNEMKPESVSTSLIVSEPAISALT